MSKRKEDDTVVIYRRYIRRNGKVYDAHKYGYKAWPIRVPKGKRRK